LRPAERVGIDVSSYQGRIDWAEVARDHIGFTYVKATEGSDFVDRQFAANWGGAEGAGIPRGAYHFFTLCSTGAAQARNFLRTVPADPDMLAPAVDLELSGNCHLRPPVQTLQRDLHAFVAAVEASTHQKVVAYVSGDFERRYRVSEILDGPHWARHLLWRPKGDWTMWQVDSWAQVKGVSGGVDLDVLRCPSPCLTTVPLDRRLVAMSDRPRGSGPAAGRPDRVGGIESAGKDQRMTNPATADPIRHPQPLRSPT
jgi:lysozyme